MQQWAWKVPARPVCPNIQGQGQVCLCQLNRQATWLSRMSELVYQAFETGRCGSRKRLTVDVVSSRSVETSIRTYKG